MFSKTCKCLQEYIKILLINDMKINTILNIMKKKSHNNPYRKSYPLTRSIINTCFNIEHGNLKLNKSQKKFLKPYRHLMKSLINKDISLMKKNRIINQQGGGFGFITALLSAALPLIAALINK